MIFNLLYSLSVCQLEGSHHQVPDVVAILRHKAGLGARVPVGYEGPGSHVDLLLVDKVPPDHHRTVLHVVQVGETGKEISFSGHDEPYSALTFQESEPERSLCFVAFL